MPSLRRPLTLALDARTVHRAVRRGTGKNLIDLYSEVLRLRPQWRVIGYHRGQHDSPLTDIPGYEARYIDMPGDRFDAWQQWRLPYAAKRDGVDLLHCPANTCPRWQPVATMLTVHDLLPLAADARTARQFRRSVEEAVRRNLTIITPSSYTKSQLIQRFNADPQQIVVNYWAPDQATRYIDNPAAHEAIRRKYQLPAGQFALHLGAPDKRKNTQRVIEAFANLPVNIRRRWSLLIVGIDNKQVYEELTEQVYQLGAAGNIRIHGFADEADMPALFSAAQMLAYPSLAEGFGLPILDAFATRTAVLTSACSCLPEVAGDAAQLVEPTCVASIRRGMTRLMSQPLLRMDLVKRGQSRLSQFGWELTARRFIGAVEQALALPQQTYEQEVFRRAAA